MRRALVWTVGLLVGLGLLAAMGFAGRYCLYRFALRPQETLAGVSSDWLGPLDQKWEHLTGGKPYAIQRVSDPSYHGSDALRFEVRKGDAWLNKSGATYRAEIETHDRPPINSVRWYRFALLLPADFPIEDNRLILFQWHGSDKKYLGEPARSPTLAFRYSNGVFSLTMRHSPDRIVRDPDHVPNETLWKTRAFPLGQWSDFVVQAKWSYQPDGFVRVWWNGRQVVNYAGPVGYNDDVGPYVQFGLYRDASDQTYVSYISNVRGGSTAGDIGFAETKP